MLPNGFYNVGVIKLYPRNDDDTLNMFLIKIELTDKETILFVECFDNERDRQLSSLSYVTLEICKMCRDSPKNPLNLFKADISYTFIRSEPLSYNKPLNLKRGKKEVIKFYFTRLDRGGKIPLYFTYQVNEISSLIQTELTMKGENIIIN